MPSVKRKPRPQTKKLAFLSNGLTGPKGIPKGTSMNGPKPKGISLNAPGFPLGDTKEPTQELGLGLSLNDAPNTFQTRNATKLNSLANLVKRRKEQALKNNQKNKNGQKNGHTKKAIKGRITERKGNSLANLVKRRKEQALKNNQKNKNGQKNGHTKKAIKGRITERKGNSLANLVKRRKEQALKNNQKNKNGQKNGHTKKAIKGRITDRKRNALAKVLEKVNQDKEDAKVKRELAKLAAENSPKTRLAKEKKEEWNLAAKEEQEKEDFENLFGNRHEEQPTKMEGMEAEVANELFKATTRAQESNREAMKKEERLWMGPRRQKGPKSNTNLPDFRGELDETKPKRWNATNNITK
jgi:hypothetical protein